MCMYIHVHVHIPHTCTCAFTYTCMHMYSTCTCTCTCNYYVGSYTCGPTHPSHPMISSTTSVMRYLWTFKIWVSKQLPTKLVPIHSVHIYVLHCTYTMYMYVHSHMSCMYMRSIHKQIAACEHETQNHAQDKPKATCAACTPAGEVPVHAL